MGVGELREESELRQPPCVSGHHGVSMKCADPQVSGIMTFCSGNEGIAFGLCLVPLPLCDPCRGVQSPPRHPGYCSPHFFCQWLVLRWYRGVQSYPQRQLGRLQGATQAPRHQARVASPEQGVIICTKSEWEEGDVFPKQ